MSGSPLTVFFRPDRTSSRLEVVFELGRMWASATPANLGAYTAQIYQGSTLLATIAVPAHYWYSRWRWQSSPRPVVGSVSQMLQQGLLPPYDQSSIAPPPAPPLPAHPYQMPDGSWVNLDVLTQMESGNYANASQLVVTAIMNAQKQATTTVATQPDPTPALGGAAVYTVMGLAGVTAYMPQTGERPDIGLVTEPQAEYICTANTNSLQTVMAQVLAGGTMPWHMRDENTCAPLNFNTYPNASWYPDQVVGSPYIRTISCPVTLDGSHMPGLVYLPYLLTGDPYHLEDLQFQANWNWGWYNPTYRPRIPQARGCGVEPPHLGASRQSDARQRSVLAVAASLLGGAALHVANVLHDLRQLSLRPWISRSSGRARRSAPARIKDRAHRAERGCRCGKTSSSPRPWAGSCRWASPIGRRPSIGKSVPPSLAPTGRPVGSALRSTPYRTILRSSASAPLVSTWTDAYNLTASVTGLTYKDPNTFATTDMTYLGYTRGALVYANMYNVAGASACLSWATGQLVAQKWPTDYKGGASARDFSPANSDRIKQRARPYQRSRSLAVPRLRSDRPAYQRGFCFRNAASYSHPSRAATSHHRSIIVSRPEA